MKPNSTEWNISALPKERQEYLGDGRSFEEIADRIFNEARITEAWIEHYRTPPEGVSKKSRQVIFRIGDLSEATCDLFYNAPDGLRGRYWQGPDIGFLATRYVIDQLRTKLLSYSGDKDLPVKCPAAPMNQDDIRASLDAPSAKVWPRERDDKGNSRFKDDDLNVPRWAAVGSQWKRSPILNEIEVKGAILSPERVECVPKCKIDRSCQIHYFGFS